MIPESRALIVINNPNPVPLGKEFDSKIVTLALKRIVERRREKIRERTKKIEELEKTFAGDLQRLEEGGRGLTEQIKIAQEEQKKALEAWDLARVEEGYDEHQNPAERYDQDNRVALEKFVAGADSFRQFAVGYLMKNRKMLVQKTKDEMSDKSLEEVISYLMCKFVYPAIAAKVVFTGNNFSKNNLFIKETLHAFILELGKHWGESNSYFEALFEKLKGPRDEINLRDLVGYLDVRMPSTKSKHLNFKPESVLGQNYCHVFDRAGNYIFHALKIRELLELGENEDRYMNDDYLVNRAITEIMAVLSGIEPAYLQDEPDKNDCAEDCRKQVNEVEKRLIELQGFQDENSQKIVELKRGKVEAERSFDPGVLPELVFPNIKADFERLGEQLKIHILRRKIRLDVERAMAEKKKYPTSPVHRHELESVEDLADTLLNENQNKFVNSRFIKCKNAPLSFSWYQFRNGGNTKNEIMERWEWESVLPDVEAFYSMINYVYNLDIIGRQYYKTGCQQQKNTGEMLVEIATIYAEKAVAVATEIEVKLAVPEFSIEDIQQHIANLAMLMDGTNVEKILTSSVQVHEEFRLMQEANREVNGVLALETPEGQVEDFEAKLTGTNSNK